MTDLPLVSIVTPSYNQAAYLEQTILSVINQDFPNIEYMVVDGGSNDGSVDIIRRYAPGLKWWVSEPDRGQADAIDKGWGRANGEIIAYLNSDDFYLDGAVTRAVQALQQHPEWGMVYGDMLAVDRESELLNIQRFGEWGLEDLMSFHLIAQPSVFLRRSVLEKAGFLDIRFHYMLDHHLWLRMARLAPIGHLPQFLSAARFHADAKNIAQAPAFGRDAFTVLEWMEDQPDLLERLQKIHHKVYAGVYWLNGRYHSEGGLPGKAMQYFARSLFEYPSTVLGDWRRVVFTLAQMVGAGGIKEMYNRKRRASQIKTLNPGLLAQLKSPRALKTETEFA